LTIKVNHLTAHAVAAGVGYKRGDGGQLATSTPGHEKDTVVHLIGRSRWMWCQLARWRTST